MTRTYGTLRLVETHRDMMNHPIPPFWRIAAEPQVMIRLKAVFPRVDKGEIGVVHLRHSDEICRELEWFLTRFPLEMDGRSRQKLAYGAQSHVAQLEALERVLLPDFTARAFPLAKPLRHYQSVGVEIYLRTRGLLCADQLGLGKTVTAIGSLTLPETLPALVVCQTHLVRQWRDFLKEFLPSARAHIIKMRGHYLLPPAEVYLVSYHKLNAWANFMAAGFIKSVIFDEVQELRREESDKYKGALAVRRGAAYALGLSATPIYNYGGEIFNIMEVLAPDRLGSRAEFQREWCSFRGQGRWLIRKPDAFGQYLRENFLMIRRTRPEVGLELPPVERIVQTIEHTPEVLEEIADEATELAHRILQGTFVERGQAAREFDLKLREATGIAKATSVAAFVRMLVEDGQQVLLFGWHRAVYDVWREKLADLEPLFYTGTESLAQKEEATRRFQHGKTRVLIMSLRAGSGVDGLQMGCSTAVFGELDWSPGIHEQCIGRLNRDGAAGGVSAFFLVSDAGSDPMMAQILGLKTAQLRSMIDPEKKDNLGSLQTDGERVKQMAAEWLKRHHKKAPEQLEELTSNVER